MQIADLRGGTAPRDQSASCDLQSAIPKIADFGLARRLDPEPGNAASFATRSGGIVGTPGYMSPEQVGGGGEVGPAADIYGLGAVLYECLTGRAPFQAATPLETLDLVRTRDPVPPRQLSVGVPADLETICLKCLRKEARKRYGSALELADDLGRFLRGEPIRARPTGVGEKLWKWARRRPSTAALVVVSVLALAVGLVGGVTYNARLRQAAWDADAEAARARAEGQRADGNYRNARETLRKILARTSDPRWKEVPRLEQLRRSQAEVALEYFDAVARQQGDDPRVRLDVAYACLEAGKLQLTLGQRDPALESLRRADRLSAAALEELPDEREIVLLRADVLHSLGMALDYGEPGQYLLEQSMRLLEALVEKYPSDRTARWQLASDHLVLGGWYVLAKRFDEAERSLLRALRLYDGPERNGSLERDIRVRRAGTQVNLAALYRQRKNVTERDRHQREAEAELQQALAADPTDHAAIGSLALLRINGAYDFHFQRQHAEGLAYVTRNVPLLEAALKLEPEHGKHRHLLRLTHGVRATVLDALNRYPECVQAWEHMMAYSTPADAEGARTTLVELLRRAGELSWAIAEADTTRKGLTDSTPPELWKRLEDLYEGLASDAGKETRLPPEQRQQLQHRLRDAAREAAEQRKKLLKIDK